MSAPATLALRIALLAAVSALIVGCGPGSEGRVSGRDGASGGPVAPSAAEMRTPGLAMGGTGNQPDAGDQAGHSGLASLPPGQFQYYPPGEYLKDGYPVSPPPTQVSIDHTLHIMQRQVSQAEFAACVRDKGCKPLDKANRDAVSPDMPVVGVSWRDATDYAAWLSRETGRHWRLPSFAEWIYAAGPEYEEDIVLQSFDPDNPAQRWLAEYKLETQRGTVVDAIPRPFGGFGQNASGMQDMVGNVWDWTDTCHSRVNLDLSADSDMAGTPNCGVRVVAGPHRSVITDFIRDPKGGACSVGIPPSNLGFRLVRDDSAPAGGKSLREKLGLG